MAEDEETEGQAAEPGDAEQQAAFYEAFEQFVETMQAHPELAGESNIMEALFRTFKAAIEQTNTDHDYWLDRLKQYQEMGDALSDYLKELVEAMGGLGGSEEPELADPHEASLGSVQESGALSSEDLLAMFLKLQATDPADDPETVAAVHEQMDALRDAAIAEAEDAVDSAGGSSDTSLVDLVVRPAQAVADGGDQAPSDAGATTAHEKLEATAARLEAEREAAWAEMAAAIGAAVASGAAGSGSAAASGAADAAELEAQQAEIDQALYEEALEQAEDSAEATREQLAQMMQKVQEHAEQEQQAIRALFEQSHDQSDTEGEDDTSPAEDAPSEEEAPAAPTASWRAAAAAADQEAATAAAAGTAPTAGVTERSPASEIEETVEMAERAEQVAEKLEGIASITGDERLAGMGGQDLTGAIEPGGLVDLGSLSQDEGLSLDRDVSDPRAGAVDGITPPGEADGGESVSGFDPDTLVDPPKPLEGEIAAGIGDFRTGSGPGQDDLEEGEELDDAP